MSTDTKVEFGNALNYVQKGPQIPGITNEIQLAFYGYFKQATIGQCNEKAPSRLKVVQKMKWDSWNKHGKMSTEDAMKGYIKTLEKIAPKWKEWSGKAKL